MDTLPAIGSIFIDVPPMESAKIAYYTPIPRLQFLTGYYSVLCSVAFISHDCIFKVLVPNTEELRQHRPNRGERGGLRERRDFQMRV